MVEPFKRLGTDSEAKRNVIFEKTGMISAIYDNGTHYAANHQLEMLKEISDDQDVLEITGEYTERQQQQLFSRIIVNNIITAKKEKEQEQKTTSIDKLLEIKTV